MPASTRCLSKHSSKDWNKTVERMIKNPVINSNPYGICNLSDISSFESDIKFKLPEDYRNYILKHNGANFKNEWFVFHNELLGKKIHGIHAITDEPKWVSIREEGFLFIKGSIW